MKKKNKMSKQIKCYNINYLVEEEDLSAKQNFNSIDDLHNSLPKEVILGKEEVDGALDWFEEKLADDISDETGWLVKSFDWKVEESPTIFYDKENSLDRFMKGKKS